MKNPSIFGSSQKRGVLIPICSRFESVTFRESEAILTLPEVCQQSEPPLDWRLFRLIPQAYVRMSTVATGKLYVLNSARKS
ncbi:hypothetical protein B3286c1_1861 [Brucella vulpis]|uniref:hypothetical protein n=1 Tax=Brucella vulpis TaxID=981386 RepID=UPI00073ADF1B|nr:hypothetical protein BF3285c1_1862 [Brucella vulpis]CUW50662.1 hypothetical protein B3286c1_1861 [Brucella vulpis]